MHLRRSNHNINNLQTGVGYITEFAGRDRAKFFRRPVEPTGDVLTDFSSNLPTNIQFASSCPALSSPLHESDFFEVRHSRALSPIRDKNATSVTRQSWQEGKEKTVHDDFTGGNKASTSHVSTNVNILPSYTSTLMTRSKSNKNVAGKSGRLPSLTCKTNTKASVSAANNKANTYSNNKHLDNNEYNNNISSSVRSSGSSGNRQGYFAASDADKGKERCDAATETMYCEIDVQTNPFSPDYYIPDLSDKNAITLNATSGESISQQPEILGLAHLHWNDGLPAGREEVELIERLRRRRNIEEQIQLVNAQLDHDEDHDVGGAAGMDVEARRLEAIELKYNLLHELEEQEWSEREEHVAALQERRLHKLSDALAARELARAEANRERLDEIKTTYLNKLQDKLTKLEAKRLNQTRRQRDKLILLNTNQPAHVDGANHTHVLSHQVNSSTRNGDSAAQGKDLISSYVKYGHAAGPPSINLPKDSNTFTGSVNTLKDNKFGQGRNQSHYDVRPLLLTTEAGTEQVEQVQAPRIEHLSSAAFAVPENAMINKLPTLYKRHEAEKLIHYLTYAQDKIDAQYSKRGKLQNTFDDQCNGNVTTHDAQTASTLSPSAENANDNNISVIYENATNTIADKQEVNVYDLYRATPKPKRPDTPTLELESDITEELADEGCVLLQKLLRGRAVQNDYYDGKERCMGLITELQAASNASYEYTLHSEDVAQQEVEEQQKFMVDHTISSATADIIDNTLGVLFQELTRQRDAAQLTALKDEAQGIRSERESIEIARRDAQRVERDRQALQFAAYSSITDRSAECYLHDLYNTSIDATARDVAVHIEQERRVQKEEEEQHAKKSVTVSDVAQTNDNAQEEVVCTLLDRFIIPTAVYLNNNKREEQLKRVPAIVGIEMSTGILDAIDKLSEEKESIVHKLSFHLTKRK